MPQSFRRYCTSPLPVPRASTCAIIFEIASEDSSPLNSPEFVTATAPIPTVGVVGRAYPIPNLAINGELTFFRTPSSLAEQLDGNASYTDFDINGTFNFTKNFGAKMGYRRTTVFYDVEFDRGDLKFTGLYFGGVVRY